MVKSVGAEGIEHLCRMKPESETSNLRLSFLVWIFMRCQFDFYEMPIWMSLGGPWHTENHSEQQPNLSEWA